jgi:hypothetical protein
MNKILLLLKDTIKKIKFWISKALTLKSNKNITNHSGSNP